MIDSCCHIVATQGSDHPEALILCVFPGMCCLFPLETHRHNLLESVATALAFGIVFRDFRLFCFGSNEKCTQSVLMKWTILYLFVMLQISTLMSRTPTPRLP